MPEFMPDQILLATQINDLSERLQSAYQHLHTNQAPVEVVLAKHLNSDEYQTLVNWLRQSQTKLTTTTAGDALQSWRRQLNQLPKLTITLFFKPSQSFTADIISWLASHGLPPAKLTLTVDSNIVGGAIVAWQGCIHDASIAQPLSKHLAKQL